MVINPDRPKDNKLDIIAPLNPYSLTKKNPTDNEIIPGKTFEKINN